MAASGYTIWIGGNQSFSWVNINRANKTINSEVQMCHTEESELYKRNYPLMIVPKGLYLGVRTCETHG